MIQLKWQDPPTAGRAVVFGADVRDALRANPGAWAIVHNTRHKSGRDLWKRKYGADGFEFAIRTVKSSDPKRYDVYARFNPEAVSA